LAPFRGTLGVDTCVKVKVKVKEVAVLIGELAQRTGASARSLRHYDRRGLLPVSRTPGGYREFPTAAVAAVKAIRGLLACGLTLAEVRMLLPCTAPDGTVQACGEVLESLHRQLHHLDQRAAEVEQARRVVQQRLSSLAKTS
jgi:DNA-binding transcriptional MerR regulator